MIKSFIYLDEQKMYSLSSQLFEGITDYIMKEGTEGTEKSEQQKGSFSSGNTLGDVIKKSSKSTERKFIHDHAFTAFEKFLEQEKRIAEIAAPCDGLSQRDIFGITGKYSFIRVKARATFHDYGKMASMFSDFNRFGRALVYAGAHESLDQAHAKYEEAKKTITDRNQLKKLEAAYKEATNVDKIAKAEGMQFNQEFLDSMSFMTKHGFQDQFEISQSLQDIIFSSCLKRELLRDTPDLLIKKYSRKTEKEVVVFGLISQSRAKETAAVEDPENHKNMRSALFMLNEHLAELENSLSGKQDSEIVIDPIAAYFEV